MAAAVPPPVIPGAVPPVPALQTVVDAMQLCGIDNIVVNNALGNTAAVRVANEIFSNDFNACMDIPDSEIDDSFKAFNNLTIAQGQVRVLPGVKRAVKVLEKH